jgi:hypothetical protein
MEATKAKKSFVFIIICYGGLVAEWGNTATMRFRDCRCFLTPATSAARQLVMYNMYQSYESERNTIYRVLREVRLNLIFPDTSSLGAFRGFNLLESIG